MMTRTPKMNDAVRKVLIHHGLTKVGDGVVEADLIDAVLTALAEPSEPIGEVVSQYSYQSVAWVEDCPEEGTKLFTHPASKLNTDLTPGWVRAVDEEMVCAHIGVANLSDSYESAKAKLKALIDWHIAVATDPAVNGGWQLVPKEPTPKMCEVQTWDFNRFYTPKEIYKAMLAAAMKGEQS